MDTSQLVNLGLTEPLAKAYMYLLQNGRQRPPQLAEAIDETRTNAYSLLDRLVDLRLVRRIDEHKKIWYEAESPSALETLVAKQREEIEQKERLVRSAIPDLLTMYQASSEKPGVRFYEGEEGMTKIYREQIREGKPVRFIRSRADIDFFGFRFMHNIRQLAPKAGLYRYAFTPDSPEVPADIKTSDRQNRIQRTWYKPEDYTAPVEWSVFGNKVAAVSFGKEAISMIIDSPQIAESMRQIFKLLDEGLRQRPDYDTLPTMGEYRDVDSFVEKYNDRSPKLTEK